MAQRIRVHLLIKMASCSLLTPCILDARNALIAKLDLISINPTNIAWQAATSLVAPLIDGGLRESQVEQATAEQSQAIAGYADTVLNAFQEVEGSLDQTVVLRDRAVSLEEAAREANNALRIANLRYEEGETDLLDVLTIQQRVLSNEGDVVSIERAQLDEWIALNLALGGSWE